MFFATMKIKDDDEIIALAPPALQKTYNNQVTMMSSEDAVGG